MNVLTAIPALYRKWLYLAYTLALVIWGAISLAYTDPDPDWINKGGDILQYLGVALGLTAAANVTALDRPTPAPKNMPKRDERGESTLFILVVVVVVILVIVVLVPRM